MRLLLSFLLLVSIPASVFAQKAKIEGTITETETGQPLTGASVVVKGSVKGVYSDVMGHYMLNVDAPQKITLVISYNGSVKEISEIEVVPGAVIQQPVTLERKVKTNQEVVVKAVSAKRETAASLITFQKNTNTVASVISAEAIRRSPDKNTGEVLKRVPGASVQEGKYLVIRGLADRYNQSMLNGILLSSTEPDRKTFSFDIFPAMMIENIVINKAFVPELPGEWAGGLVQVQTKEIPASNFVQLQIGTGFNTATIGHPFLQAPGGNLDWLGVADHNRALPDGMPTKNQFANLSLEEQNSWGKKFRNAWAPVETAMPLNASLQLNTGFTGKILGKKAGAVLALTYNQTNRRLPFQNAVIANNDGTLDLYYNNNKFSRDVLAGALANFTVQLNNNHKISWRNMLNVNSSDFVIDRFDGRDYILGPGSGDKVKATEMGFRQNTFFNTQITGEHNLSKFGVRFKWYGGFNILDQYIPDQRRLFYTQDGTDANAPFYALIGSGSSQKSGSIFYSFLNDYIYNTGADLTKTFSWKNRIQSVRVGYLFQVKDRLFDSRPFFMNTLDNGIRTLPQNQIFAAANIGTATNQVQFGELTGKSLRYLANTIMNAGYVQFDNQLGNKWRVVYGVRVEDFDQLVGSTVKTDERFVNTRVTDFLPGLNITYKLNASTNIRFSGSQTVARPEFRELSPFAFYDFELNAQVVGNSKARRSKISNLDLRYEWYPRGGEVISVGTFYKYFRDPIEYYFNRTGPATNTFNISNTKQANVFGAEFEIRKKLDAIGQSFKNFTFTANCTYIHSRVKDTVALNRPLQGQSPYLINAGLQYDLEAKGFNATLLFNQIGRRILFVGNEAISDIWENPRPLIDLQIAKKILNKRGEIKLNISDLLNQRANFYHDLDGDGKYAAGSKDVLAISRNNGTNFSISFSYNLK